MKKPYNRSSPDEVTKSFRLTLEAQADKILRGSGVGVLAAKDEERLLKRRVAIIGRNLRDDRILNLHGSDSFIEISRKPATSDNCKMSRGLAVPFSPAPDRGLFLKEQHKEIDDSLEFLFDIFQDDKIVKCILIAIIKYDDVNYGSNKSISSRTGFSVECIVSAKARMKYKLSSYDIISMSALLNSAQEAGK